MDLQHNSKPADLTAARQLFPARGIHKDLDKHATSCAWSNTPYPTQPAPRKYQWMVGMTRGRCTVTGFFGEVGGRSYWVTRCQCGGYELLRGKTLRRPERGEHMCARCRAADHNKFATEREGK